MVILFPLNNDFLQVKQMIYVLIYFMHLYLRYSLTSTSFTIRMVAKWYQRVVSDTNLSDIREGSQIHRPPFYTQIASL